MTNTHTHTLIMCFKVENVYFWTDVFFFFSPLIYWEGSFMQMIKQITCILQIVLATVSGWKDNFYELFMLALFYSLT